MMKNEKYYNWSLITYASPDEFQPLLDKCAHSAYIYHDKDDNENHYHLICVFQSQRTLSAIKRDINSTQNTLGQKVNSLSDMFHYLTHDEADGKELYPIENVVCDDMYYWTHLDNVKDDSADCEQLVDDFINGIPLRIMLQKYGRDLMRNFGAYHHFAHMVYLQEQCGEIISYQRMKINTDFKNDIKKDAPAEPMQLDMFTSGICSNSDIVQQKK
jgi:plasmid replication protein